MGRTGRPPALTQEQIDEAIRLYNKENKSAKQIAAILGCSDSTVRDRLKKSGVELRTKSEISLRNPKRKSTADHAAEIDKIGKLKLLSEYKSAKEDCLYLCLEHKLTFPARPDDTRAGQGLFCCKNRSKLGKVVLRKAKEENPDPWFTPSNKLLHIAELEILGRVEYVSGYIDNKTNARYRCLAHDKEYEALPNNVQAGQGLKCCLGASVKANNERANKECKENYTKELEKIGILKPMEEYIDNETPIIHRCLIHNELGPCAPSNAKMGKGIWCCKVAASRKVGITSTNRFMPDSVWKVLTNKNDVKGPTFLYLYESPAKGFNKFGIAKNLEHRRYTGHYGKELIDPIFYLEREDAVLIEQAYKYGYAEIEWPKKLDNWSGKSELTKHNSEEFIEVINDYQEQLLKLGRWGFAEEYCDPNEVIRATQEIQDQ